MAAVPPPPPPGLKILTFSPGVVAPGSNMHMRATGMPPNVVVYTYTPKAGIFRNEDNGRMFVTSAEGIIEWNYFILPAAPDGPVPFYIVQHEGEQHHEGEFIVQGQQHVINWNDPFILALVGAGAVAVGYMIYLSTGGRSP